VVLNQSLSFKSALFDWLQLQTGLHITSVNEGPVLLALKVFSAESGESQDQYAASLIGGVCNPQPFFDAVTTHESFFLRHRRHMEVAIEQLIRPLLKKGIRPRVLSAPCAQGEEPYSFAMLLQEHGINPELVEICAVDIARSSIEQAKRGRYRKYALRQVPQPFVDHHFHRQGEVYQIFPPIQRAVQFQRMNLLTEAYLKLVPGFHLIFCHNMLIYFDHNTRLQMLGVFEQLLAPQGHLLVDTTEVPHVSEVFDGRSLNGVRLFHKSAATHAATLSEPGSASHESPATTPKPPLQRREPVANRPPPAASKRSERAPAAVPAAKAKRVTVDEKRRSAEAAYQNKQFDEAIRLYDQLIDNHPLWGSWARLGKAKVLIDSGAEMEALEEAEAALSNKKMVAGVYLTRENEADAHAVIALVLMNKGMSAQMSDHLRQVRRLNPEHEVLRLQN
jgi:chemotaxis protein methyltransferase WspC